MDLDMTQLISSELLLERIEETVASYTMPILKKIKNIEMLIGLTKGDSRSIGQSQINEAKKVGIRLDINFVS
jgi:hypothetical protein